MSDSPSSAGFRMGYGLVFSLAVGVACFSALLLKSSADLIGSDFIRPNPARTHAGAIFMGAVMTPILGLVFTILALSLPIATAGVGAKVIFKVWSRIPFWSIPLLAVACSFALSLQLGVVAPIFRDEGEGQAALPGSGPIGRAMRFLAVSLFYLLPLLWAWRHTRNAAALKMTSPRGPKS